VEKRQADQFSPSNNSKRLEMSSLDMLKQCSIVVADTGDFNQLKVYKPQDATTNPTLILQAIQLPEYQSVLDDAIGFGKKQNVHGEELIEAICDKLIVNFGCEILKIIPGLVSTEVNSSLSFDVDGSISKARKLIKMYEDAGVEKPRVMIKMAATWEGCVAAKTLEAEGIRCNMTLVFSLTQAIAAAHSKATLISPFVGRITDWYKKNRPDSDGSNDFGVESVKKIYEHLKSHSCETVIMGASFRSIQQLQSLAGCDKLTISPKLLEELQQSHIEVSRKIFIETNNEPISDLAEKQFRWEMNEDQMATDLLSDGIRRFHQDSLKLRELVKQSLCVSNGTQ